MTKFRGVVFATIIVMTQVVDIAFAVQFAGSRGGVGQGFPHSDATRSSVADLSTEAVQGYITIAGKSELRVAPTSIRIVIAVTAEAESPAVCQAEVDRTTTALKAGWKNLGIADEKVVDDFIAVLPRYLFEIQEKNGQRTAVERKSGFILQSNLHVAVKDDAQAMAAVRVAFANGISDIIAFDYWNDQIENLKKSALASAIKSAKEKSAMMLEVFEEQPRLINIVESTEVIYPESLYHSFENSNDGDFYSSGISWRDIAVFRTFRPKNTYYRGLYSNSDLQPNELPMKSEISIVSTVKLYYESPIAREYLKLKQIEK